MYLPNTLDPLFAGYRAAVAFYGHNHTASDIQGRGHYVNPGSLGCYPEPLARFVIINVRDSTYALTKHAVPYDDTDLLWAFAERHVPDHAFIRRAFFGR